MAKFKNIFTNIFTKTNAKLETDAAIIPHSVGDGDDKDPNYRNNISPLTEPGETRLDPSPSSSGGDHTNSIVPASRATPDQLMVNPAARALTQNIINNVQNNALTAPQTSITNATGVQVYQIKNARNVHIGNSITFNSANTEDDRTRSPATANGPVKWANLKLSDTIRQMMDCEDDLDTDMMIAISRHLGYEWKQFARTLEYSEGQIEAFECDNDTLSERIYQFILDWSRNDDEPTLGKMVKLLWEHVHKETVYHMKLVWKKRQQS
ncbi:protein immune deficiency [Armigeres subalbatus]|uniref:protein immune deficiency n=1 Tax=Armigeres subalbatus TaxID=124917 RepID=UPI002ED28AD0